MNKKNVLNHGYDDDLKVLDKEILKNNILNIKKLRRKNW